MSARAQTRQGVVEVPCSLLISVIAGIFERLDAPFDIAVDVAQHLVDADLAGHESHGVLRAVQYVELIESGALVPGARPTVLSDTAATALIDGHRGFGQLAAMFGTRRAIDKAREVGAAWSVIRHGNHFGRLGAYTAVAAEEGFVCIMALGSIGADTGLAAPFGGRSRVLGTNPWSVAVPCTPAPIVFDAATTTIAEGKNRVALARGKRVAAGCLLDSEGAPSTYPADLYSGGSLLPLGGDVAGHKGYGFAVMAALLGSLGMISDDHPSSAGLTRQGGDFDGVAGCCIGIIDPNAFGGVDLYREQATKAARILHQVEPRPGVTTVQVPGEPEVNSRDRCLSKGTVPLTVKSWAAVKEAANRLGVQAG